MLRFGSVPQLQPGTADYLVVWLVISRCSGDVCVRYFISCGVLKWSYSGGASSVVLNLAGVAVFSSLCYVWQNFTYFLRSLSTSPLLFCNVTTRNGNEGIVHVTVFKV